MQDAFIYRNNIKEMFIWQEAYSGFALCNLQGSK